jgi:hypothetical protein
MSRKGFKYYLSRVDVAQALSCSVATVRRMEGRELHPRLSSGVHLFDPLEVEGVAAKRAGHQEETRPEGTIAAAVFAALDRGLDMKEIVTTLEVHPEVVLELYQHWVENDATGFRRSQRTQEPLRSSYDPKAVLARVRDGERALEQKLGIKTSGE